MPLTTSEQSTERSVTTKLRHFNSPSATVHALKFFIFFLFMSACLEYILLNNIFFIKKNCDRRRR